MYWGDPDTWQVPGVDAATRERALGLSVRDGRCWLHTPPGESIGLDWAGMTRLIVVATEIRDRLLKR